MTARTWFALLAPPVAWFAALNAAYFMVGWACGSTAGLLAMHLALLAMLAITLLAGAAAWGDWRSGGGGWPDESADPDEVSRFVTTLAILGAALFSLLIIAKWIAALVLGPCEPAPRLPFSPSALAAPLFPALGRLRRPPISADPKGFHLLLMACMLRSRSSASWRSPRVPRPP